MNNKKSDITLKIVLSSMFAALITVMTAFIKIPTPTGGYVHLGDAMIYLTSCFLPFPFAMIASALGGGLADLLVYPETLIFTVIIKALNSVFFSAKDNRILTKFNVLMTIPSGLITIIGYSISKFIRDLILGTSVMTAFIDSVYKMPENAIQAIASAGLFFVIAYAFDKSNIKSRLS